jgi:dihydropteroate synthase
VKGDIEGKLNTGKSDNIHHATHYGAPMKKKQLVAILNCTPDSYYIGSRYLEKEAAIKRAIELFEQGADIVDIGGESTRPGSDAIVSAEEELSRVIPVIEGIRKHTDKPLSIDTYKPQVAEAALAAGVNWINDITGLSDPHMRALARASGATVCIMHMYGAPHTAPTPHYPQGVIEAILSFFRGRLELILASGISPSQIVLDPGIGGGAFGKSPDQVLQIIKHLRRFTELGYPLYVGLSRKSFLQHILQKDPSQVLSTTLALNTIALQEGASYIRVHDVAEHRDILTVLERLEAVK